MTTPQGRPQFTLVRIFSKPFPLLLNININIMIVFYKWYYIEFKGSWFENFDSTEMDIGMSLSWNLSPNWLIIPRRDEKVNGEFVTRYYSLIPTSHSRHPLPVSRHLVPLPHRSPFLPHVCIHPNPAYSNWQNVNIKFTIAKLGRLLRKLVQLEDFYTRVYRGSR